MHPRAARVLAGTKAVLWPVPFFGLPDLVMIVVHDPGWLFSYLLFAVLGACPRWWRRSEA